MTSEDTVPALQVYLDRQPSARLEAPLTLGSRAWVLGVAAVQITTEGEVLRARLRTHVTGATEARIVPLAERGVVHVALAGRMPRELPDLRPPSDGPWSACLRVALDGQILAEAQLPRNHSLPWPRAYGHAFCRWLRGGGAEPGFDLCAFATPQRGAMAERLLVRALMPGQVVSYAYFVT